MSLGTRPALLNQLNKQISLCFHSRFQTLARFMNFFPPPLRHSVFSAGRSEVAFFSDHLNLVIHFPSRSFPLCLMSFLQNPLSPCICMFLRDLLQVSNFFLPLTSIQLMQFFSVCCMFQMSSIKSSCLLWSSALSSRFSQMSFFFFFFYYSLPFTATLLSSGDSLLSGLFSLQNNF